MYVDFSGLNHPASPHPPPLPPLTLPLPHHQNAYVVFERFFKIIDAITLKKMLLYPNNMRIQ